MKMLKYSVIIVGFTLAAASVRADSFKSLVNKGNQAFSKGDFKGALQSYHEAEVERPEVPELYYNVGSALYKEGKYEEAEDKLQKSFVTTDIKNEAMAHYNLGNVYYRAGDYQKAIQSYQKSLELVPEDLDAKYNLELARKRLKEQMKPQQQKQNPQQPPKQDKDQQQKDQQQQPQENQEQNPQQQKAQKSKQQEQQVDKNDMTKEDAERILNAVKDDENELQKDVRQMQAAGPSEGNDW